MAAESASGVPLGLVTALPADRAGDHPAARRARGRPAVPTGAEVAARLAADRAYIDALRRGEEPVGPRLDQACLSGLHEVNLQQARQ